MSKLKVYICYHNLFGVRHLQKILDSEKEARVYCSRNPEYLDYEVWEVGSKAYD